MYVKKRLIFSKCQFIDLEEDVQYIYIYIQSLLLCYVHFHKSCVPTEYSEIRFRILRIRYLQGLYLKAIV